MIYIYQVTCFLSTSHDYIHDIVFQDLCFCSALICYALWAVVA